MIENNQEIFTDSIQEADIPRIDGQQELFVQTTNEAEDSMVANIRRFVKFLISRSER